MCSILFICCNTSGWKTLNPLRVANVLTKIWIGHILQTDLKIVATTSACSVSEKGYYVLNFVIYRLPIVVKMVKYGQLPVRLSGEKVILKWTLKNRFWQCEWDSSGSEWSPVMGCSVLGSKSKAGECLDHLRFYKLLKPVQTGPGAYPASYMMGTRSFPMGRAAEV